MGDATPIPIADAADPRLAPYANLTDAQLRATDASGARPRFIAEGELVVRQLLASDFAVESVLASPAMAGKFAQPAAERGAQLYVAAAEVMQGVVGFPFHRGVMACGLRGPGRGAAEVLAASRAVVILEDLANHDNVGGVFRDVGALVGAGAGVLLSPRCCDPLYRKSLRVSIGQALRVPYARLEAWPQGLEAIKAAGFEVFALTPDSAAEDIIHVKTGKKVAILMGAEGPGLSAGAFGYADRRVRIAINPAADSLNVSVATAVALHRLVTPA